MASRPQDLIFQLTSNAQPIFNDIITEINQALISEYITYDELQRCLLYLLIPETTWIKTLTLTPLIQPIQTQTTPINQFTSKDLQSLQYNLGIFLTIDQQCLIINGRDLSHILNYKNYEALSYPLFKCDLKPLSEKCVKYALSSTWVCLYLTDPIFIDIFNRFRSLRALPQTFKQIIQTFLSQPFTSLTDIYQYIKHLPKSSLHLNPTIQGSNSSTFSTLDPYAYIDQYGNTASCISKLPHFKHPTDTHIQKDITMHIWIYWVNDDPIPIQTSYQQSQNDFADAEDNDMILNDIDLILNDNDGMILNDNGDLILNVDDVHEAFQGYLDAITNDQTELYSWWYTNDNNGLEWL